MFNGLCTPEEVAEMLGTEEEIHWPTGYEDCIIGLTDVDGKAMVVLDADAIVEKLFNEFKNDPCAENSNTEEELWTMAEEYFSFNIEGSRGFNCLYMRKPLFIPDSLGKVVQ